jgi:hypothetical protein
LHLLPWFLVLTAPLTSPTMGTWVACPQHPLSALLRPEECELGCWVFFFFLIETSKVPCFYTLL